MNANEHILNNIIWSNLDSEKDIFSKIYERNLWYSDESFSGKGSEKKSSENILNVLPKLFSELKIQTILDAPCGDYFWMKELKYSFKKYTGIDIVEELIKTNNLKYSNDKIEFMCLDIICNKLPKADLILCRDCFIHLSFENIFKIIENFKNTSSKYLLVTTYKNIKENIDIYNGGFRKLDLTLPPFDFKKPELEIFEEQDKYLSLWRIDSL